MPAYPVRALLLHLSSPLMPFLSRAGLCGLLLLATGTACKSSGDTTGPRQTPSTVRAQTGNGQAGTVGVALTTQLSVLVTDASGKPVAGARVDWDAGAGSGTLAPGTSTTNASGIATTTWTLGTVAGTARATAQVAGVNPVVFTATAAAGLPTLVIATPELAFLGVGDTLRVRATLRDAFGNSTPNQGVAFVTLDPSVAAVSNDGLISAVSVGTARIVASAAGRADTVPVTVLLAGASVCGPTAPRTLALGEVLTPPLGAMSTSVCLGAPTDISGEYALALISTASSYASIASLDVYGIGITGPTTAALAAAIAQGADAAALSMGDDVSHAAHPVRDAELARRATERRELAPLADAARAWQAAREDGITPASLRADAKVGDIIRLNANGIQGCTAADTRAGRVAAVGTRVLIVADTTNPTGGYNDAEYASIAAQFDTLIYPVDTAAFGAPSNISSYGKIILFYSRAVNALTPPSANFTIGGFFFSRDLYPRTARNGLPGCAASNENEMFYLLVPDPNGVVNGNRRTKEQATLLNLGTIAHELQHLINASRRLYVTPNAVTSEETWLDEGLSHVAEELLYFRISGYTSRQNLTLQDVQRQSAAFTNYGSQNFARFYAFLINTEASSPYAPNDSLATRGASWNLLRFIAGRQGAAGEAPFFRALVNSPTVGFANLNNATGGQIADYLRDWAVSNIADDYSPALTAVLDAQYRLPAWNFRNIYPGLRFSGGSPLGVYPISTRTLLDNAAQRITLGGGTSSYVRFGIARGKSALLTLSANGTAPPSTLRYAVVRLR